jgi:hypothetical protein
MMGSSVQSDLPFSMCSVSDKSNQSANKIADDKQSLKSKAINVVDFNGSGRETLSNHKLSMDNEELVSEREEVIEENQSSGSNEDHKQEIIFPDGEIRGNEKHKKSNPTKAKNQKSSFCTARAPSAEPVYKRPARLVTSRENVNKTVITQEEPTKKLVNKSFVTGQKPELVCPTPIMNKKVFVPNSGSFSMRGIKSITRATLGLVESTQSTIEPSKLIAKLSSAQGMRNTKRDSSSFNMNPTYLNQLVDECKGGDNLTLSSAGIVFGAGTLSQYVGVPQFKNSIFQSFNQSKQTLPLNYGLYGQSGSSSNMKTKKGIGHSIDLIKVKKKNIIPISDSPAPLRDIQTKLNISSHEDIIKGRCRIKSVRLRNEVL